MITRILCSLLLCCIPLAAHAGAVFQERGDAGDFASPQDVVGASISSIQGSIGGGDSIDVFRFHFAGGPLAILARLDDSGQDPTGVLPIRLVRESGLPDDACFAGSAAYPPNPCISEGWLDFSVQHARTGQLPPRRVCRRRSLLVGRPALHDRLPDRPRSGSPDRHRRQAGSRTGRARPRRPRLAGPVGASRRRRRAAEETAALGRLRAGFVQARPRVRAWRSLYRGRARMTSAARAKLPAPRWCRVCRSALSARRSQRPERTHVDRQPRPRPRRRRCRRRPRCGARGSGGTPSTPHSPPRSGARPTPARAARGCRSARTCRPRARCSSPPRKSGRPAPRRECKRRTGRWP